MPASRIAGSFCKVPSRMNKDSVGTLLRGRQGLAVLRGFSHRRPRGILYHSLAIDGGAS
jgi:hypothetical protein